VGLFAYLWWTAVFAAGDLLLRSALPPEGLGARELWWAIAAALFVLVAMVPGWLPGTEPGLSRLGRVVPRLCDGAEVVQRVLLAKILGSVAAGALVDSPTEAHGLVFLGTGLSVLLAALFAARGVNFARWLVVVALVLDLLALLHLAYQVVPDPAGYRSLTHLAMLFGFIAGTATALAYLSISLRVNRFYKS
jgi:hypothetical protein